MLSTAHQFLLSPPLMQHRPFHPTDLLVLECRRWPSVMAVVVSVLGGMGSMAGSVLGGLLVGVIISTCQAMGYGAMAQAIVYALVFIAFLIRPNGLIKSKQG